MQTKCRFQHADKFISTFQNPFLCFDGCYPAQDFPTQNNKAIGCVPLTDQILNKWGYRRGLQKITQARELIFAAALKCKIEGLRGP